MITFPHVGNEQPWAWQRKATHPSALVPTRPATNTLFPPLKHQSGCFYCIKDVVSPQLVI